MVCGKMLTPVSLLCIHPCPLQTRLVLFARSTGAFNPLVIASPSWVLRAFLVLYALWGDKDCEAFPCHTFDNLSKLFLWKAISFAPHCLLWDTKMCVQQLKWIPHLKCVCELCVANSCVYSGNHFYLLLLSIPFGLKERSGLDNVSLLCVTLLPSALPETEPGSGPDFVTRSLARFPSRGSTWLTLECRWERKADRATIISHLGAAAQLNMDLFPSAWPFYRSLISLC